MTFFLVILQFVVRKNSEKLFSKITEFFFDDHSLLEFNEKFFSLRFHLKN